VSTNYGIDAPIVLRNLSIIGFAAIGLCVGILLVAPSYRLLAFGLMPAGPWFLVTAGLMFAGSRWGKPHARDALLRRLRLRGDERLLDVGCGHGLLLIGAAKLLLRGRAIGIDIWSQVDQVGNRREATMANAEREGVSERVEILDADMRALPFPDASIDVVVASLSIHNIPGAAGRARAVQEIARVLKPGGQVALLDFQATGEYMRTLREMGWSDVSRTSPSCWMFPPYRTVLGRKPR
jgi:arsenite methyltransferase